MNMEGVDDIEFSDYVKDHQFNKPEIYTQKYMTNHRRFCMDTVKINPEFFKSMSPHFRQDEELSIIALKQKPKLLFSCGSISRANPKVVQTAIELDPTTLQFAAEVIQDDENFILKNAKILGKNIMYCYNFKRDPEMMLKLVKENPECFEGADKYLYHNKEFKERVNSIVGDKKKITTESGGLDSQEKENFSLVEQVKFIIETKQFEYERKKETFDEEQIFYHLKSKYSINDEKLILEDPMLLKFSIDELKGNQDFVMILLRKNPIALKYASEKIRSNEKIIMDVFENLTKIYKFFSDNFGDRMEFSLFLEMNDVFNYLPDQLKTDKKIVLLALESNGNMLEFVSKEFKNDKEIVIKALKSSGKLEYASDYLKNDEEILKIAMTANMENFKYFPKQFQSDKQQVKNVLNFNGNLLKYCSEEFKNDKEVAMVAISQTPLSIQFASQEIKNDKDIVMKAIKMNGNCMEFISDQLKNDKEVVIAAIKNDGKSFLFADEKMKQDEEIISIAIQKYPFSFFNLTNKYQENEDLALSALKKDHNIFDFLPDKLKEKKVFLLEILKFQSIPLTKIPNELQNDKDILLMAIKTNLAIPYEYYLDLDFLKDAMISNQGSLIFAPFELQNDKEFILNLVRNSRSLYCIPPQFHTDQEILWLLHSYKPIREINQFENINFKFRIK